MTSTEPTGPRNPLRTLVSARAREAFRDLLDPVDDVTWISLDSHGSVHVDDAPAEPNELARVEVAWLSNDVFAEGLATFTRALHDATALRWLQSGAAGTDSDLFRVLADRGVRISTAHVTAGPIAEYVLGAVLREYQQAQTWEAARQQRAWAHHDFLEVAGTRWLVIGVGEIGGRVARLARAFGAQVTGVRRTPTGREPVDLMIGPADLHAHAPLADVVVIAASGTPSNDSLVDRAFLDQMNPGAILVNVARGALVDEAALIEALDQHALRHAILDVARVEPPPPDSPLWSHPRITLTPHSSGAGKGRYRRSAMLFLANLDRYRRGQALLHEVDPADLPTQGPLDPTWIERSRQ